MATDTGALAVRFCQEEICICSGVGPGVTDTLLTSDVTRRDDRRIERGIQSRTTLTAILEPHGIQERTDGAANTRVGDPCRRVELG